MHLRIFLLIFKADPSELLKDALIAFHSRIIFSYPNAGVIRHLLRVLRGQTPDQCLPQLDALPPADSLNGSELLKKV